MKYLFLGLLFTVRLEHLQEKTLKEHNSLGRYDPFLVSSWFSGLLFRYFDCDNLVISEESWLQSWSQLARQRALPDWWVRVGAGPAEGAAAAGVRSGPSLGGAFEPLDLKYFI